MNISLNYTQNIKKIYVKSFNIYNVNKLSQKKTGMKLSSSFGTFKSEKNLKLIKLYNLLFLLTGQRPFLKRIKFNYIKKKILKRFFLVTDVSNKKLSNSIFYLIFYLHFFHLYYQQKLKYNYSDNSFTFYIDNIQFFFKNYNKQNHKTQIKFEFLSLPGLEKFLPFLLSNFFLIKFKR